MPMLGIALIIVLTVTMGRGLVEFVCVLGDRVIHDVFSVSDVCSILII